MRDIVGNERCSRKGSKRVVEPNDPKSHRLYRIRKSDNRHTFTSAKPHNPRSPSHHITTQSHPYDTCTPFFSHAFNLSCFTFVCLFSSLRLTWLTDPALVTLVYPNRMQYTPRVLQEASLLDGVDAGVRGNGRRFSKTSSYPPCRRYAFNRFYHYFLTMSSSPLFSLIHSLLTTHYTPASSYKLSPRSLCPLSPSSYQEQEYFLFTEEQCS